MGGIIFVPGRRPEFFGARLTEQARLALTSRVGQRQVIGQAEILPVLVAKVIWEPYLRNRKALFFIDNDSARLALVRGYSPVLASLDLIMRGARLDAFSRSSAWYSRVPTKSNIADSPSRMVASLVQKLYGASVVQPRLEDGSAWFSDTLREE